MKRKVLKGLVSEKSGDDLILLIPGGEFVTVAAKNNECTPGMEIEVSLPVEWKRPLMRSLAGIAAIAVIFMLALQLTPPALTTPAAYLALDINPSLVLLLDEEAVVVGTESHNEEGVKLLEGLEVVQGLEARDALDALLEAAYQLNYLLGGRDNVIMVSLAAPDNYKLGEDDLRTAMATQLLHLEVDSYLRINTTSIEKAEQAREMAIPLNALLLGEKLRDERKGVMPREGGPSLLEGSPPLPVREFLENINPADLFGDDEFVAGENGKRENEIPATPPSVPENVPSPPPGEKRGEEAPSDGVEREKPIDVPVPPVPEQEGRRPTAP